MYAEIVLKSSKADTAFDYSKIYLTEFEIMITDGVFIWTELTKLIIILTLPKLCLKGELACAEILVRFHAVARDAGHGVAQRFKLRQARVEIVAFGGAAGGVVFGIKIHNQRQMFVRYKILAAGSGQGERISRHNKAPESFRRPYLTASAPAAPR